MDPLPPNQPGPESPRRTIGTWLAWAVILMMVATLIGRRYLPLPSAIEEQAESQDVRVRMVQLELQGRVLIGTFSILGKAGGDQRLELEKLNRGNAEQRLRIAVLAGELLGQPEALDVLRQLDDLARENNADLSEAEQRARTILGRLYQDYARDNFKAPSVTDDERAFLIDHLGWFGDLALHPREGGDAEGRRAVLNPARRTFFALFGFVIFAMIMTVIGLFGAVLFLVLAAQGWLSWRITTGIPHGGVYAETFALWLVSYLVLGVVGGLAFASAPALPRLGVTMLASLIVLAWPLVRGVSWRQLRDDIGLKCQANPLVEIGSGIACYIINLPLVAVGVAMTLVLLLLQAKLSALQGGGGPAGFDNTPEPVHPILQYLSDGDWLSRLQVFLLASVIAPIVEEIMFRGVFHRHCRELTGRWNPIVSALASTTMVSFIFASIHPQGLVTIPPLMFMAFGFSLMREWRGSLLPSMFAHGMSNGTVLTVATIALSR